MGAESVDILGTHIDSNGVKPLSEKVQAVQEFPQLQTPREIVHFYHHFVPHCAKLMQPLYSLLKQTLSLAETALTSFQATKDALALATLLSYPMPDAPTCVATDASNVAVGAVLQQYIGGIHGSQSPFSRKVCDLLRLGTVLSIENCLQQTFPPILEGRQFHILTDHKPLTFALNVRPDRHSPHQAWQLDFIAQFTVQSSDMYKALTTSWLMPCRKYRPML